MAISVNNEMNRQEVVDYFNQNVVDVAFSNTTYNSGNVPKYTASATAGTQWSSWGNGNGSSNNQYKITGAEAIPSTQLSDTTKTYANVSDLGTQITASTLINTMRNLAKNCSRIRNTVCNWYHDISGTDNLIQTITGSAIYLATTPAISGSTRPYYTKSPDTTNMTIDSTTGAGDIAVNNMAKATSLTQFVTNLVNEWNTRYNTTVTYTYYTCHSVCHSSCYDRARR